jgi:hypothetical protein
LGSGVGALGSGIGDLGSASGDFGNASGVVVNGAKNGVVFSAAWRRDSERGGARQAVVETARRVVERPISVDVQALLNNRRAGGARLDASRRAAVNILFPVQIED